MSNSVIILILREHSQTVMKLNLLYIMCCFLKTTELQRRALLNITRRVRTRETVDNATKLRCGFPNVRIINGHGN